MVDRSLTQQEFMVYYQVWHHSTRSHGDTPWPSEEALASHE